MEGVEVSEVEKKEVDLYILVRDREGDESTAHAQSVVQQWPTVLNTEQ